MNWRRAVSAILAVGLRPCSGALIVLVFRYRRILRRRHRIGPRDGPGHGADGRRAGLPGGGAGGAANRLGARLSSAGAARLRYGVEALAALAVLLLGILLLGGMLAGGG